MACSEDSDSDLNDAIRAYVVGIVNNHGQAEPSHIENMLKNYLPEYCKPRSALMILLNSMTEQQVLTRNGNVFTVNNM